MSDLRMTVGQALAEVPVNALPLIDDTDFKTRETAIAFDAAGMDLVFNFVDANGNFTQTAVTPTSAGVHDWTHQGDGIYTIEIPASGGTINNDAIGFGWFSGFVTGVLPWRGPIIEFGVPTGLSGTFSGTHSSTTSDLGANAPTNDVKGMTLYNPTDGESRVVTAYDTGTGIATHAAWDTGSGVTNGEPWLLIPTAPIDTVTLEAIQAEMEGAGSVLNGLSSRYVFLDSLDWVTGMAQAGAAGAITLEAGEVATDDYYNNQTIYIRSGTGSGQSRVITDYVGSTLVASVEPNWATNPDGTSVYVIVPAVAMPSAIRAALGLAAADLDTQLGDVPTVSEFNARTLVAAAYFDPATDTVDLASVDEAALQQIVDDLEDGGRLDLLIDAIKVVTDALTAAAAAKLALSTAGIITGAAETGTLSTTQASTDLTGFADDELIGRVVVFTGGTAAGQASEITDYANTNGVLTFGEISTAPADGDTFIIV